MNRTNLTYSAAGLVFPCIASLIEDPSSLEWTRFLQRHVFVYQFGREGLAILNQMRVIEQLPPSLSFQEVRLYQIFLLLLNQIPRLRNLPLTLLAAPGIAENIVRTPWFQNLLSRIRTCEIRVLITLAQGIAEEYTTAPRSFPVRAEEEERAFLERYMERISSRFLERMDHLINTVHQVRGSLQSPALGWEYADQLLGQIQNAASLRDVSLSSLFVDAEAGPILAPRFHQRILSAWTLGSLTAPSLSPLLFTSADPDLAELGVRTMGIALAVFMEQSLLPIVLTECALKLIPARIQDQPWNREVGRVIAEQKDRIMALFNREILNFENKCRALGIQRVEQAKQIVLQGLGCIGLMLLGSRGSPFVVALNVDAFCLALGALLANQGLAQPRLLMAEVNYWCKLPYLVCLGALCTAIANLPLEDFQEAGFFLTLIGALPFVTDKIISSRRYKKICEKIMVYLSPELQNAFTARQIGQVMLKAHQLIRSFLPGWVQEGSVKAKILTLLGSAIIVASPLYRDGQRLWNKIKKAMLWIYNQLAQSYGVSVLSHFLGTPLASVTPALGREASLPKKMILGTAGAVTGAVTGNSLASALAIEAADHMVPEFQITQVVEALKEWFSYWEG